MRFEDKKGRVGFLLKDESYDIYKLKNNKLVKTTPTDNKRLCIFIGSFLRHKKTQYKTSIGFMAEILGRTQAIVFKIKDFEIKRNSNFTCNQAIKTKIINKLKDTLDDDVFKIIIKKLDDVKLKNKLQLCICLELFMRYYQRKRKDDKIWFLTQQEVYMNKLG